VVTKKLTLSGIYKSEEITENKITNECYTEQREVTKFLYIRSIDS
jgi:hypothetical protein